MASQKSRLATSSLVKGEVGEMDSLYRYRQVRRRYDPSLGTKAVLISGVTELDAAGEHLRYRAVILSENVRGRWWEYQTRSGNWRRDA